MNTVIHPWDYLIVTASNASQASAYETHLKARQQLGFLNGIRNFLVVDDPDGKRIGSGGSTLQCWMEVLKRELGVAPDSSKQDPAVWESVLQGLRILIIHAGGDSKRLPVYGPCGKLFIPVPGESGTALGDTLFDRQLPVYLELPPPAKGTGQTVITTGDVLLLFDPGEVKFRKEGITGLASWVTPEIAQNHGLFCADADGQVICFAQKPSLQEQEELGAINRYGKSLLDIGVMNIDPGTAVQLLKLSGAGCTQEGDWAWRDPAAREIEQEGLDFYLEICSALGKGTSLQNYIHSMQKAGSHLSLDFLERLFSALAGVPFFVHQMSECGFLHFGTQLQLIQGGSELMRQARTDFRIDTCLCMNNHIINSGRISGDSAWVEGCLITSDLFLAGRNVVVGADILAPLSLPEGLCLDVLKGRDRKNNPVWFVRVYGISDNFKAGVQDGSLFDVPAEEWFSVLGVDPVNIWEPEIPPEERSLWNARLFPAVSSASDFIHWLWQNDVETASDIQKRLWQESDRYSLAEIAERIDQEEFFQRRWQFRAHEIQRNLRWILREKGGISARELVFLLQGQDAESIQDWIQSLLREALRPFLEKNEAGLDRLDFSRIIHTLASTLLQFTSVRPELSDDFWPRISSLLTDPEKIILKENGLDPGTFSGLDAWCRKAQHKAFENVGRTIVKSTPPAEGYPHHSLRSDEIIWGRAPARLDLGGGWSDTPPYSLEHGGCVINAAANLNGQPPIQAYARIIKEPEIRITSIDHGTRITIHTLFELLDYREATSIFGLAKAALALSGLEPERAQWPTGVKELDSMLALFGGGIELTTLAAIPSGSGLGTSSIMGAVLISVINRMIGRQLTDRELFHAVLQLEQELTTGGGWQDQIGGTLPGVKMITTEPGLVPDPRIHYVPADVLDPVINRGQTLLYYTGMRRLAKNILRSIVGNYLDRDRSAMEGLAKLHAYPPLAMDAMSRKDMRRFGACIDLAWKLNLRLDPDSTTPAVEKILDRFRPYMYGAKLMGAGAGGFLLVVCKSVEHAVSARRDLENDPPNPLARFVDFGISSVGLEVTVC